VGHQDPVCALYVVQWWNAPVLIVSISRLTLTSAHNQTTAKAALRYCKQVIKYQTRVRTLGLVGDRDADSSRRLYYRLNHLTYYFQDSLTRFSLAKASHRIHNNPY
jgi:hypothetical protein